MSVHKCCCVLRKHYITHKISKFQQFNKSLCVRPVSVHEYEKGVDNKNDFKSRFSTSVFV